MRKPNPATVIASVALFFSLGGGAMAATGFRITSLWQIAPSVRHALRGETGARGPQGVEGPTGAQGPQGPAGMIDPSKTYTVYGQEQGLLCADSDCRQVLGATATASCHPGDATITGGYVGYNEIVTESEYLQGPTDASGAPTGGWWQVTAHRDPSTPVNGANSISSVQAWVLCQSAS